MNYPVWEVPVLGGGLLIGGIAILHVFMWAWAIEWVLFFVEIVAALVYYYGWDRLDRRSHLAVGWIYAAAAWLSLFVINGILSFMLTPGRWLDLPLGSRSLWGAFANPTMVPSLILRALCRGMIALDRTGSIPYAGFIMPKLLRQQRLLGPARVSAAILIVLLPLCLVAGTTAAQNSCQDLGSPPGLCCKAANHADHLLAVPAPPFSLASAHETPDLVTAYGRPSFPSVGHLSTPDGRAPPLA